jgi:26S proteasome regulatory subunit T1
MSPQEVSDFLDGVIRNRISVRLIAEQHIAVSQALKQPNNSAASVGVVDMECSPRAMIRMCGSFVTDLCEATLGSSPSIVIDGQADATFAYVYSPLHRQHGIETIICFLYRYVPVHLEYILTEILKNSFRATVEQHTRLQRAGPLSLPPVVITISPPPERREDTSKAGSAFLSIRIRDQGGGVLSSNMARIFSYAFTTAVRGETEFEDIGGPYAAQHVGGSAAVGEGDTGLFSEITGKGLQTGLGTIAGLGYGLPMSRLYAK